MNRSDPESPSCGDAAELAPADAGVAWMKALQHGDERAFDEIVAAYQSSVFQFVLRTVGDADRADDLVQETFLRVYRARQSYTPTARFTTWLLTIARRLALNELRSQRRRRRVIRDVPAQNSAPDEANDFLSNVADRSAELPHEALERHELNAVLRSAVAELPTNQRAALELQFSEHLSYAEIAEVLETTPSAVKSLLVRAREKLRATLVSHGGAERSPRP